jgi:hypothetical protein
VLLADECWATGGAVQSGSTENKTSGQESKVRKRSRYAIEKQKNELDSGSVRRGENKRERVDRSKHSAMLRRTQKEGQNAGETRNAWFNRDSPDSPHGPPIPITHKRCGETIISFEQ